MVVFNAAPEKSIKRSCSWYWKETWCFWIYERSTIEALLDCSITNGIDWSWLDDFKCKLIIDESIICVKELDGFTFGMKSPKELQTKWFKIILNPIPGLMGCCILYEKEIVCFDKSHPSNSLKRLLTDEITL